MKVVTYDSNQKTDFHQAYTLLQCIQDEINKCKNEGKEIAFILLTKTEYRILKLYCLNHVHTDTDAYLLGHKLIIESEL